MRACALFVVVEQFLAGREFTVSVLGNERLESFPIQELWFDKLPEGNEAIMVTRAVSPGQNISFAGSDIARGQTLLHAGTVIGSDGYGYVLDESYDASVLASFLEVPMDSEKDVLSRKWVGFFESSK